LATPQCDLSSIAELSCPKKSKFVPDYNQQGNRIKMEKKG